MEEEEARKRAAVCRRRESKSPSPLPNAERANNGGFWALGDAFSWIRHSGKIWSFHSPSLMLPPEGRYTIVEATATFSLPSRHRIGHAIRLMSLMTSVHGRRRRPFLPALEIRHFIFMSRSRSTLFGSFPPRRHS